MDREFEQLKVVLFAHVNAAITQCQFNMRMIWKF